MIVLFVVTIAETTAVGSPIVTLRATDADDEAVDNVFSFDLAPDESHAAAFYVTTEAASSGPAVGVVRVKQVSRGHRDPVVGI